MPDSARLLGRIREANHAGSFGKDSGSGRNMRHDDHIRTNDRAIPDSHGGKNHRAGTHLYMVPKPGPFMQGFLSAIPCTDGGIVTDQAVIADDGLPMKDDSVLMDKP